MSWKVRAIVRPGLATGFRLAGIAADEVTSPEQAAALIESAATQPTIGILLVEQELLDAIPESVRRPLERNPVPIVVPVPRAMWGETPTDAEGLILALLRRAIGYRVKLR